MSKLCQCLCNSNGAEAGFLGHALTGCRLDPDICCAVFLASKAAQEFISSSQVISSVSSM